MTIGIGVLCRDGIVVATDTQYTSGTLKSQGPKIFTIEYPDKKNPHISLLIAGAGRVAFMKRAVDYIKSAMHALDNNPTLSDVRSTIEDTLLQFFKKYVYPIPDQRVHTPFELVIGAWVKSDGFALFASEGGPIVNEVARRGATLSRAIGAGRYVADYALALTHLPGLNVKNAKYLAAFSVSAAKAHVETCGGQTKIYTLRDSGFIRPVADLKVADAEDYSKELFALVKEVLVLLDTDGIADDKHVEDFTDLLRGTINAFRERERQRKAQFGGTPTRQPAP